MASYCGWKDYKSNVKPEFYNELNDSINIKEVRDYVINLYDNEK